MKFRARMSRRETEKNVWINVPFRTGKLCATVWASRAAREPCDCFRKLPVWEWHWYYWTYCLWSSAARVHHPALFLCFLTNLLQSYLGHPRRSLASLSCLNAIRRCCCCSCTSCGLRTNLSGKGRWFASPLLYYASWLFNAGSLLIQE